MSRVYFHAEHDEAEIRGSERAYLGLLCASTCEPWMPRGIFPHDRALYEKLANADYLAASTDQHFSEHFRSWFRVAGEADKFGGESPFVLALNTAIEVGSDAIYLAARIHGQCEINAYFDPSDFEWLGRTIQGALDSKLYRSSAGWEDVLRLIGSDCGPVVMSYSVCEQFPNYDHVNEEMGDWELSFEALGPKLRIKHEPRQLFGEGKTIFSVLEAARAEAEKEAPDG